MDLWLVAPNVETIYYLYILNDEERLLGVLSLKHLILAASHETLKDFLIRPAKTVPPEASEIAVA